MSFTLKTRRFQPDGNSTSTEQRLIDLGLLAPEEALLKPSARPSSKKHSSTYARTSHKSTRTRERAASADSTPTNTASTHAHSRSRSLNAHPAHATDDVAAHIKSSRIRTKTNLNAAGRMAGMMETDRVGSRRERTFAGGNCAACEEPLELTLSGERVLQFSCGHVSHEACFYEYIRDADCQYCPTCDAPLGLDSARGGNILDLSKLSSMVRAIAQNEYNASKNVRDISSTWDRSTLKSDGISPLDHSRRYSFHNVNRDSQDSNRARIEKLALVNSHSRNNSETAPTSEYSAVETASSTGRRHDYDLHAMETILSESRVDLRSAYIAPPIVTIRSEFPTVTRSSQQQSLACLVTVEVPEAKWRSARSDMISSPQIPQTPSLAPPPLKSAAPSKRSITRRPIPQDSPEVLEQITTQLQQRVENWHGLEFQRFGTLRLYGSIRVGKDRQSWQELECYLFGEMLICVKEKKNSISSAVDSEGRSLSRAALKGSILIKRHLRHVQSSPDDLVLTLTLTVAELPTFHLQFRDRDQMDVWKQALLVINQPEGEAPLPQTNDMEQDASGAEDDEWGRHPTNRPTSSLASSYGPRTNTTAATDYSNQAYTDARVPPALHVPLDIVVVIPVSSSMAGLKIGLLRDTLRFLVSSLGERDRMGLVTFGSGAGAVPLVGMTTNAWTEWDHVISSIRPVGQKSLRADAVEGANVAMDLLMQRKGANPISTILLISDSSTSDNESVDFVVQRAEAAKVGIYAFGLGLTHRPDSLIELASRTRASYTYVKDWMMLRECISGCLGSLQSTSHRFARIRLRLPEGSPAKFVKISGALSTTKRATGREAEALLGDLRFGDKRDILVQLGIDSDNSTQDHFPQDHWESIVSGLEALGGSVANEEERIQSIDEVPLLQADLSYGDLQRDGTLTQLSRPSLLTITMLPRLTKTKSSNRPATPPIPPHPSVVQRRMELLTSDMLSRALTLVSRNQHDRAHHLLSETRTILKGLAKGGLPPLPSSANSTGGNSRRVSPNPPLKSIPPLPDGMEATPTPVIADSESSPYPASADSQRTSTPVSSGPSRASIDPMTMQALDTEIESALEWINHPAVFSRDSRKAVLQAIVVISSQRAYTFRTASEAMYADRILGVRAGVERSRDWKESELDDKALAEEQ